MKDISVWPIKTGNTFMRSPARWRGAACSSGCFRGNFHQERCICLPFLRKPRGCRTVNTRHGGGVARVHRRLRGGSGFTSGRVAFSGVCALADLTKASLSEWACNKIFQPHAECGILTLRKQGSAVVGGPCGTCCTRPFLGLASGHPCRPRWLLWRGRGTL